MKVGCASIDFDLKVASPTARWTSRQIRMRDAIAFEVLRHHSCLELELSSLLLGSASIKSHFTNPQRTREASELDDVKEIEELVSPT